MIPTIETQIRAYSSIDHAESHNRTLRHMRNGHGVLGRSENESNSSYYVRLAADNAGMMIELDIDASDPYWTDDLIMDEFAAFLGSEEN